MPLNPPGEIRVALLRHGEVVRPSAWLGAGRHYVGQLDLPLSERGQAQARAWAARLKDDPPAVIHASDLSRTAETAALLAAVWRVPVHLDAAWREIELGDWDGLAMDAVQTGQPDLHAARGANPAGVRPPGGEHFGDLARRVWPACLALEAAVPPGRWGLAVTHAGVIRTLRLLVQGRPLAGVFGEPVPLSSLHRLLCNAGGREKGTGTADMEPCPLEE
ncbi:histidine phosphatase family protein [Megalodesulfovibrio paquesii]